MKQNIIYLSRLKAISCIAVVILHTFYAADSYASTDTENYACLIVRNLMMWAVPCFVMSSGALLLDKKRNIDLKKLFGRYILRMISALLIFSVLFSVFDSLFMEHKTVSSVIADGIKNAVFGTGWNHMWYIYMMLAIYLLLPVYRLISHSADENEIKYLLAVYMAFLSVLPLIETASGNKTAFYICVYTVYPFYLFIGYALHNKVIDINNNVSAVLAVLSGVTTAGLTIYGCNNPESFISGQLGNYSFPAIIFGSAGIYSIIKSTETKEYKIIDKVSAQISSCSFGIYLIHMALLKYIFAAVKFNPFEHGGFITILTIAVFTFAVSFAFSRMLKFIPFLKKII